jgi:hypothetical protein
MNKPQTHFKRTTLNSKLRAFQLGNLVKKHIFSYAKVAFTFNSWTPALPAYKISLVLHTAEPEVNK